MGPYWCPQRRGGDWQVSRKNLVMFLTNASADAVGPRNSCLVPLPPHLQTRIVAAMMFTMPWLADAGHLL